MAALAANAERISSLRADLVAALTERRALYQGLGERTADEIFRLTLSKVIDLQPDDFEDNNHDGKGTTTVWGNVSDEELTHLGIPVRGPRGGYPCYFISAFGPYRLRVSVILTERGDGDVEYTYKIPCSELPQAWKDVHQALTARGAQKRRKL